MLKIILPLLFAVSASAGSYTTDLQLYKPATNDTNYVTPFANGMNTLDAAIPDKRINKTAVFASSLTVTGPLTVKSSVTAYGIISSTSGFIGPLTGLASLNLPLTGGTLSGALTAQGITASSVTSLGDMRVNGNLGVGTLAPKTMLQITHQGNTILPGLGIRQSGTELYGWDFVYDTLSTGDLYLKQIANNIYTSTITFAANGNVGINTTTPLSKLHVNGDVTAGSVTMSSGTITGNAQVNGNSFTVGGSTLVVTGGKVRVGSGTAGFPTGKFGVTQVVPFGSLGNSGIDIAFNGTGATYTETSMGGLNWNYDNTQLSGIDGLLTDPGNGLDSALIFKTSKQGGATLSEKMRINRDGNVGIGTTAPATTLDVVGANTITDSAGNMIIRTNDAQAADVGGNLTFGGNYVDGGARGNFAGIAGRKENSTSTSMSGYLSLSTTLNTTTAERVRITSTGAIVGNAYPATGVLMCWGTGNKIGYCESNSSCATCTVP